MDKDYQQMFNILEEYLKDRVQDIDLTILEAVKQRKTAKVLALRNIYAVLYMLNLVLWYRGKRLRIIKRNLMRFL